MTIGIFHHGLWDTLIILVCRFEAGARLEIDAVLLNILVVLVALLLTKTCEFLLDILVVLLGIDILLETDGVHLNILVVLVTLLLLITGIAVLLNILLVLVILR